MLSAQVPSVEATLDRAGRSTSATSSAATASSSGTTAIATPPVSRRSSVPMLTRSSPTVATSNVMVLSSSLTGLTLVEDTCQQRQQQERQQQPQLIAKAANPQPSAPLPTPPASTDDDAILLKPKQHHDPLTLPSMRRTRSKRVRRKSIVRARVQPFAKLQTVVQVVPVPSLPSSEQHPPTDHLHQEPPQVAESSAQPQPQAIRKKGANRQARKPRHPWTQQQYFWMDQQRCLIGPIGSCAQRTESGSLYCVIHSCRALLADATPCGGAVHHPRVSRVCDAGYHRENTRIEYVEELLANRAEHDAREQQAREDRWADRAAFFRREYGEACTESPWYNPQPVEPVVPLHLQRCSSAIEFARRNSNSDIRPWVGNGAQNNSE